jgi:PAS domain-containing protein
MNPLVFTHLLVVADSLDAGNRLISGLRGQNMALRSASAGNERELASVLAEGRWDVIVCFAGKSLPPAAVLATLRRVEQDVPMILVGASPADPQTPDGVREVIAADEPERLLAAVRREAEVSQLKRRVRQLELQQRELEKRNALLLDGSATAIGYVRDGIHLACNPSYARCFGYDSSAAIATIPLLDLEPCGPTRHQGAAQPAAVRRNPRNGARQAPQRQRRTDGIVLHAG